MNTKRSNRRSRDGKATVGTSKRAAKETAKGAAKRGTRPADRPSSIVHWTQIEQADDSHYEGDDELMSIGARFGRHFGLARIGIHHERLLPGAAHRIRTPKALRRSSCM